MVSKILFVRFSSMGDIVLTTPVLRCTRNQWHGELEIHYLTKRPYAYLLEHNPNIDQVHRIDRSTNEILDTLRELKFDYIIDLHHNARSFFLKRKLKSLSFSFNKLNKEKWLLVNFGINQLPNKHIVDRYLETLRAFKIENDGKGLDFFIPPEDKIDSTQFPDTHKLGFMAFVIGGQHRGKKTAGRKNCSYLLGDELSNRFAGRRRRHRCCAGYSG